MNYKCVKLENCEVYLAKTEQFKTIDVKCFFYKEVTQREMTFRNCLIDILLYATKNYPSKKDLALRANDLYSLFMNSSNMRFGNYVLTKIGISFLNPKYTEESMFKESLDFLHEVLFNPLVEDNHFNKDFLNYIKKELRAETETIRENPRVYSNMRLLSLSGKGAPYAISSYSDLAVLSQIDEYNLYDYYKNFLKDNRIFVLVTGNFDEEKMLDYIKTSLPFKSQQPSGKNIIYEHEKIRKRSRIIIEDDHFYQSKLAILLKLKDLTNFEYNYVANMYNSLLGGTSDNLLMRTVREQHSLAYYIGSSLCKADNLIMINSGIDARNFKKTVSLVKQIIKDMQEGRFRDSDLEKCKIEYINSVTEATESVEGISELLLGHALFHTALVEERCEQIRKVSKEDIMKLAQKVHVDTIFLLRGI